MRPVRRSTSGPLTRIFTTDASPSPAPSRYGFTTLKRCPIINKNHSALLSVDLDDVHWQQRIMRVWPKRCTFVVREIFQTEQAYLLSLLDIIEGYMMPLHGYLLAQGEGPQLIHTVFNNIIKLWQTSENLLNRLHAACGDPSNFATVFVETDFGQYREYCTKFTEANQYLQKSLEENAKVKIFIEQCQMDLNHPLPLSTYLIKPVQRILKYHLLLEEILRDFDAEDVAYPDLKDALQKMRSVSEEINTAFSGKKEDSDVSPASIAKKRSKEIQYLQTGRAERVRRQRNTFSDSLSKKFQHSLEFEDTLSLLKSTRSSSSSLKQSCQPQPARPHSISTAGPGRKLSVPTDIFMVFKTLKTATASTAESSASAIPSTTGTATTTTITKRKSSKALRKLSKRFSLQGTTRTLDLTSDTRESSPKQENDMPAGGHTGLEQAKKDLISQSKLLRSPKLRRSSKTPGSPKTLTPPKMSSSVMTPPTLPNKGKVIPPTNATTQSDTERAKGHIPITKQKSHTTLAKRQPHVKKFPLLPDKEKVEHFTREPSTSKTGAVENNVKENKELPKKPMIPVSIPSQPPKPASYRSGKSMSHKSPAAVLPNQYPGSVKQLEPYKLSTEKPQPPPGQDKSQRQQRLSPNQPTLPVFPKRFVINQTTEGDPVVSLPPPSPTSTFFPSMLKSLKNSTLVRKYVLIQQNNIVGELKDVQRPPRTETHSLEQETRRVPLLPPEGKDVPSATQSNINLQE